MENRIINTTYVPLQPPYQIIKYTGTVGMQIGTLIVTFQKEGDTNGLGYAIETHSHPVVTYEQKEMHRDGIIHSDIPFMEGVVWDHVELKDVTTICLSSTSLIGWNDFCSLLWEEIERHRKKGTIASAQPAIYWQMKRLGINLQKPKSGEYVIHLSYFIYSAKNTLRMVRSSEDDIFPLNASADSDEKLIEMMEQQLRNYSFILYDSTNNNETISIKYQYVDFDIELSPVRADERLKTLVEKLNNESPFTKMRIGTNG